MKSPAMAIARRIATAACSDEGSIIEPEQLELFPSLLQPPRRLRQYGFELEQIVRDIAVLTDCLRRLQQDEQELADVARAKASGHVLPGAYRVLVKAEEVRQIATEKLRDGCALHRALEAKLNKEIDSYLRRMSNCGN